MFLALNARFENQITDSEELQYKELFHPKIKAGVVIFGSSHAAVGINPKHLQSEKRRVFNFAFGGADPIFYSNWLTLFWEHYPQPKTVIYQVDWFLFREVPYLQKKIEYDADFLAFEKFWTLLGRNDIDKKDLLLNRFILFQNRQSLQKLLWPSRGTECSPLALYYQGFCPTLCPTTQPGTIVAPPVEARKAAFLAQMAEFKKRGIEVIWVQTPEYLPGRQIDPAYQTELEELARRLDIPFLNYNTERADFFNYEQTHFIDWAHLNAQGADNFSKRLGQDLSSIESWNP